MSYEILNRFIPESKYKLKATYPMDAQYITIHNTANDASALNEIAYMARNNNATSYHVAVDDKHAVQAIPFNRNAWHCGDGSGNGNRKSIGIEICYSKSGGPRYAAAEENAIEYVAYVLKDKGWGMDRVKWHRDWSGKNCPHRIFAEGRATSVRNRIAAKLAELKSGNMVAADNPVKKEEGEDLKFSSGSLRKELEFSLNSKAHRQMWVDAAVSQGYSQSHAEKLIDGTIEDGDLLPLAAGTIIKLVKSGALTKGAE